MKKKVLCFGIMSILTVIIIATCINVDFKSIFLLPDKTHASLDDVSVINENSIYGKFVSSSLKKDALAVGEEKYKSGKIVFKLFGLIPIKEVSVEIMPDDKVYLGGNALGFRVKTEGVVVVGTNSVKTENGNVDTLSGADLQVGDVVTHINDVKVENIGDVSKIVNSQSEFAQGISVKGVRKNKSFQTKLKPAKDGQTGAYKLGLWVKDDASGIGTLTFVDSKNLDFGALGHPITDFETGAKLNVQTGKVYLCSILGVERGERGKPGEIKGIFLESSKAKGEICSNNNFGLFGKIVDKNGIVDENLMANIGGRLSAHPGKAKIISNVSGIREEYDIEIIKASKQKSAKDKSLIIRVTDKKLLSLTGGIVQGMSGSPIIQNGKLIGAVTHVFVSDPQKGYGVYIDWMKEKAI